MRIKSAFFVGLTLFVASCARIDDEQSNSEVVERVVVDSHSYSNVDQVQTKHLHLDLEVNFDNNTIYGVARHELAKHQSDTIIFDIKDLDIKKITVGSTHESEVEFVIGEYDSILGQPLTVRIDSLTRFVNIYYQTTEKSEALDWLPPSLTEGKKLPFLYTQGQAILTRTWIPLQDTPKTRITYSADVKVPPALMAVMSASNSGIKSKTGTYHFEMKQKIPAYLIAIAVGDLEYIKLGKNCGVFAEPSLVQACAAEFVDLPKMIVAAEELYGEYLWEQYDIVVLPYSFPFGGMENPRLTFANPTLIAGDRSLVSVIAHELAHSWSGNLVTNATWNGFWLNEGFTVYFENRIMEKISGKEIADILSEIEFQDLENTLKEIEESDHPEDSQLKLQLQGRHPDDGMTDIAYVKGAYFLRTIEEKVGRKKFDAFLKGYFAKYAFNTITTEEFLDYLKAELFEPNKIEFNAEEWIYQPGLPDNCVRTHSPRLEEMKVMAEKVNKGQSLFTGENRNMRLESRITQEWQTLIRSLSPSISNSVMNEMEEKLEFGKRGNTAIQSDWFLLAVKSGNKSLRPHMQAYLTKIGRRWYVESIYQALVDSGDADNIAWAKMVFEKAKENYHYVTRSTIEEILKAK